MSIFENKYKGYPIVYANKPHKITDLHDFRVVLWEKYWKSEMYKSEFYRKHLKNKATLVMNPGTGSVTFEEWREIQSRTKEFFDKTERNYKNKPNWINRRSRRNR